MDRRFGSGGGASGSLADKVFVWSGEAGDGMENMAFEGVAGLVEVLRKSGEEGVMGEHFWEYMEGVTEECAEYDLGLVPYDRSKSVKGHEKPLIWFGGDNCPPELV